MAIFAPDERLPSSATLLESQAILTTIFAPESGFAMFCCLLCF